MGRSIFAVLAGIVTIAILSFSADAIIERVAAGAFDSRGITESAPVLLTMTVYSVIFSALGGLVTAAISRRSNLGDVLILAGIQFVVTLVANTVLFDRRMLWYYVVGVTTSTAAIVLGGWLFQRSTSLAAARAVPRT